MGALTVKLILPASVLLLVLIGAASATWSTSLSLGVKVSVGYKDPVVEAVCHKVVHRSCTHEDDDQHLNKTCSQDLRSAPHRKSVVIEGTTGNCTRIVMVLVMKVVNRGTIPVEIVGFNTFYRPSTVSLHRRIFVVPKPSVVVEHPCQVLSENLFRYTMEEPTVLFPEEEMYFIVEQVLESSPGTRFSITIELVFR